MSGSAVQTAIMPNVNATLEELLDLNFFSGSVSDVLPLLVIPAVW